MASKAVWPNFSVLSFIGNLYSSRTYSFTCSIRPKVVTWLDSKPVTYLNSTEQIINFKGYLENY